MKQALIVRHVPYEGIAGFRAPIEAAGYAIERVEVTDPGFDRIDLAAPDLLVLMGGPMGVYERDAHPWLAREVDKVRARLADDRPTLGVCLGSQIIAAALGAEVFAGPRKEVGFAPLALTAAGAASPLRLLGATPVLHWHGDTFALPEGAEHLASSARYAHQAFRRGRALLALQFHAEMGEDPRLAAWLEGADGYLAAAGTTAAAVRADEARFGPAAVAAGRAMIAAWLAELAGDDG